MKKKALALMLCLTLLFSTGCSRFLFGDFSLSDLPFFGKQSEEATDENTESEAKVSDTQAPAEEASKEDKVYGLDEYWEVPGQWRLKINSVTVSNDRFDMEKWNPAQVIIINYTYENLGYDDGSWNLFMMPNTVVGSDKKVGQPYTANLTAYPQETPKGAICDHAQASFGLYAESDEVDIIFSQNTGENSDYARYTATFKVPVQK